jgi:hypothetical protein
MVNHKNLAIALQIRKVDASNCLIFWMQKTYSLLLPREVLGASNSVEYINKSYVAIDRDRHI